MEEINIQKSSKKYLFVILFLIIIFLILSISYYIFFYKEKETPKLGITGVSRTYDVVTDLKSLNSDTKATFPIPTKHIGSGDNILPEDLEFLIPPDSTDIKINKVSFDGKEGYELFFETPGELAQVYFKYSSTLFNSGYKPLDSRRMEHAALQVYESEKYLIKAESNRIDETMTNFKVLITKK